MANVDAEGRPIDPRRDLGRRPGEPQPPTVSDFQSLANVAHLDLSFISRMIL